MFTIHINKVNDLRMALMPMATICDAADIKCSNRNLSVIVVPNRYSFIAALRILPAFFTSFQYHPVGDHFNAYRANFYLKLFNTNISNMYNDDLSVTIYLNRHNALAPIRFLDPHTGYLQFSALLLARPHNIDITPIDLKVFFAIRSSEFINLLSDLIVLPTEYVCVAVTKTEAMFKSLRKEIIFTTQNDDCIVGGIGEDQKIYFMLSPSPMYFFYQVADASKFVWFFKTVSSRNLLSFCMSVYASYTVCFT